MKKPLPEISELSVVITGATRGIGVGIAEKLSSEGAKLTLGYLENNDAAVELHTKLGETNSDTTLFKGDLTDPSGAKGIIEHALEKFGHVDALVSNLGPFLWRGVSEMSIEDWDGMIKANLSAHFYLVKELLPRMQSRGYGNFIFIGGVGSGQINGHARATAYNSAKVGLAEFMRGLAIEEGPNGIRANMIAPGIIDNGEYTGGFKEKIVDEIPLGYVGQPGDIGNTVKWLLSPESHYLTGAIIDVSGGYHLTIK